MKDEAPPEKGQEIGAPNLSSEQLKLLKSYEDAWPNRLRKGFRRDNAFFACFTASGGVARVVHAISS